jgi:RNA polymerase sigma-70 factor (ECF subfamily)
MVYNLSLHFVQNILDAEEITQDVFISVYQSLSQFRKESEISTWIYRITINKCKDHIKAKNRKKRFAQITSLFFKETLNIVHDVPEFNHPGVLLENKEELEQIFAHINSLPGNQKTAIILQKLEHKSQAEIAEILDINIKAVESLIHRAKENLSKKMKTGE